MYKCGFVLFGYDLIDIHVMEGEMKNPIKVKHPPDH